MITIDVLAVVTCVVVFIGTRLSNNLMSDVGGSLKCSAASDWWFSNTFWQATNVIENHGVYGAHVGTRSKTFLVVVVWDLYYVDI